MYFQNVTMEIVQLVSDTGTKVILNLLFFMRITQVWPLVALFFGFSFNSHAGYALRDGDMPVVMLMSLLELFLLGLPHVMPVLVMIVCGGFGDRNLFF